MQTLNNTLPRTYQPALPRNQRVIRVSVPKPEVDTEQIERVTQRSVDSMSHTTLRVVGLLIKGDLSRLRSEHVADTLGVSPTTLRRRLRVDRISYQELLDQVRQYRCECQLEERWVPGKTLAWKLGYAEVNSFYRAFKRWTGCSYSEMKLQFV
ncbi:MAG: AraC family transcriptional regulator [Luminiphilus sp.]|nr:AraC family transcriptional regulator [Luminiphilus sp.]